MLDLLNWIVAHPWASLAIGFYVLCLVAVWKGR